jgi:hypothetical protein
MTQGYVYALASAALPSPLADLLSREECFAFAWREEELVLPRAVTSEEARELWAGQWAEVRLFCPRLELRSVQTQGERLCLCSTEEEFPDLGVPRAVYRARFGERILHGRWNDQSSFLGWNETRFPRGFDYGLHGGHSGQRILAEVVEYRQERTFALAHTRYARLKVGTPRHEPETEVDAW